MICLITKVVYGAVNMGSAGTTDDRDYGVMNEQVEEYPVLRLSA
jgi:hypothetical protein